MLCYSIIKFLLRVSSGKEEIGIEEYSFSQSTLEQVYIFLCYVKTIISNLEKNCKSKVQVL